jgi:hypothetical protein
MPVLQRLLEGLRELHQRGVIGPEFQQIQKNGLEALKQLREIDDVQAVAGLDASLAPAHNAAAAGPNAPTTLRGECWNALKEKLVESHRIIQQRAPGDSVLHGMSPALPGTVHSIKDKVDYVNGRRHFDPP